MAVCFDYKASLGKSVRNCAIKVNYLFPKILGKWCKKKAQCIWLNVFNHVCSYSTMQLGISGNVLKITAEKPGISLLGDVVKVADMTNYVVTSLI